MNIRATATLGAISLLILSACGSGEADTDSAATTAMFHRLADRYGFSEELVDCAAEAANKNAAQAEDVGEAKKMDEKSMLACRNEPGMNILTDRPTEAQASAYMVRQKAAITRTLKEAYLLPTRPLARCTFERVRPQITPTQLATFTNSNGNLPRNSGLNRLIVRASSRCVLR
ncbi:MAG: hypothetical protein JJE13_11095 [Thermoleophilia bacterium]|nr:hypothetical protein [Thermoleophilia bacterium]